MAILKVPKGVNLSIMYGEKVNPPNKYEVRIFQSVYRNSAIKSVYVDDIIVAMDLADGIRSSGNKLVEVSEWDYEFQQWNLSYSTAPVDDNELAVREMETKMFQDWVNGDCNLYF